MKITAIVNVKSFDSSNLEKHSQNVLPTSLGKISKLYFKNKVKSKNFYICRNYIILFILTGTVQRRKNLCNNREKVLKSRRETCVPFDIIF